MSYPLIPNNRFQPKDGQVSDEDLDQHGLVSIGEEIQIRYKAYRDELVESGLGHIPEANDDSSNDETEE